MQRSDLPRPSILHLAILVGLVTGCDKLFSLDMVATPDGNGTTDVPMSDTPPSIPGDEDGDGVLNAADNCSVTFNPDQADGDGDMVGDACDPTPNVSIDRVASVTYFDGTQIDGAWVPDTSNWMIANGALVNTGPVEMIAQGLGDTTEHATLEIGYTATHWEDLTSSIRITLAASGISEACHVDYNAPEWIVFLDGSFDSIPESTIRHVLRMTSTTQPSTCWLNHRTPGIGRELIPAGPTEARVELVNTVQARLEYIVVYASQTQ